MPVSNIPNVFTVHYFVSIYNFIFELVMTTKRLSIVLQNLILLVIYFIRHSSMVWASGHFAVRKVSLDPHA